MCGCVVPPARRTSGSQLFFAVLWGCIGCASPNWAELLKGNWACWWEDWPPLPQTWAPNSRRVVGLTVFLGWNDSPSSLAMFLIQSIAAFAICRYVEGLKIGSNHLGSVKVWLGCAFEWSSGALLKIVWKCRGPTSPQTSEWLDNRTCPSSGILVNSSLCCTLVCTYMHLLSHFWLAMSPSLTLLAQPLLM